ncbi:MAG: aminopeptidase [Cyclobacteriaceae bacterium]
MPTYTYTNYDLLQALCQVHAPSGEEQMMKEFLLQYIDENKAKWKTKPEVITGPEFHDCIILCFGNPRTAIYAHMDSIGFTVRYQDQLVAIGGPDTDHPHVLVGEDKLGPIECTLRTSPQGQLYYEFPRTIDTGTSLVYKCDFRRNEEYITSCYLDNRLGIFSALQVASTLEDGLIIFSTYEEHGGGSVPFLVKHMVEEFNVRQALVSDITWITDGVHPGKGAVISMRDRNIPRRAYINRILELAALSGTDYQLEVEGSGSSDGRELQMSPYAVDWCFIGAAEQNVHSPDEKVHKKDIDSMIDLYKFLMANL